MTDKYKVPRKDQEDWDSFTKKIDKVRIKKSEDFFGEKNINKIKKIDLHGQNLNEANNTVKKFIIKSYNQGIKKILVITGKGSRSKVYDNPYLSEKYSVLKYSIPEFIRNEEDLNNKVQRISTANIKDGGEGAIYIFLKK